MREHEHHLSEGERSTLACLANAYVSLFEVAEVEPEEGLWLDDLLTGDVIFVRERLGTRCAQEGALLLAWVGSLLDHRELTGGVTEIPPAHARSVLDLVDHELQRTPAATGSPGSPHAVVRGILPQIHLLLRAAVRSNWETPKILAPDGEEVRRCRATYELSDPQSARIRLAAHPRSEELADGHFAWHYELDSGIADSPWPADSVEVRTVRLTLTTLTRKRLRQRKKELEHYLGKLATHRSDQFDDLGPGVPRDRPAPVLARDTMRLSEFKVDADAVGETRRAGDRARAESEWEQGGDVASVAAPASKGHRLPRTAHEAMSALVPGLRTTVNEAVRMLRRRFADGPQGIVAPEALATIDLVERFVHAHAHSMETEGVFIFSSCSAWEDGHLALHADSGSADAFRRSLGGDPR